MKKIKAHTPFKPIPNTQVLINEIVLDLLRHEGAITAKEYFQENKEIHQSADAGKSKQRI